MFKVMIVEDEPPIMRMIKTTLENVNSEFSVQKCCINGKEAVSALENEHFDLVITDIKMPIMNGIELSAWIYENRPSVKVVLLSGYRDFEYARKALEYKVFDYLPKPVSEKKIKELTDHLCEEFKKTRTSSENWTDEHYTTIVLACAGSYLLYGADVTLPGEQFWTDEIIEEFADKYLLTSENYIYFNSNSQSERYLVLDGSVLPRSEELVRNLYELLNRGDLPITVVYKTGVKYKDMSATLPLLREQLIKRLVLGKSQLILCDSKAECFEHIGAAYSKEDVDVVTNAIKSGKSDIARERLTKILEVMRENDCSQEEILTLLTVITDNYTLNYHGDFRRKNSSVKRELATAVAGFTSYEALANDIISILMTLYSGVIVSDRYEQLADDIENYIKENYNKNITSEVLASEFGFVPSYISRIFKRCKGCSPSEYIISYRISLAKKIIMESPDIRIKEVAYMVGFKESYYFSKTFKRETGVWPTEFAQRK